MGDVSENLCPKHWNRVSTSRGLRQGGPLSPLLFNLTVYVFATMLFKGSHAGLVRGLCPDLIAGGFICLQYADDTPLYVEKDEKVALHLE